MIAVFEETGEKREVTTWCKRCRVMPDDWPDVIVSPAGTAHLQGASTDAKTLCGIEADGDRWWWKL